MGKYQLTIEEEFCYYSRNFDIICKKNGDLFTYVLFVQIQGVTVEQIEVLSIDLQKEFDNLKTKYILS